MANADDCSDDRLRAIVPLTRSVVPQPITVRQVRPKLTRCGHKREPLKRGARNRGALEEEYDAGFNARAI